MDRLFSRMALLDDREPHSGAVNMAIDESLLRSASGVVLRVYGWDTATVSFGYTMRLAEVRDSFPDVPLVRRWTGGGIVEHGTDLTFSIIVPRSDAFAALQPAESYRKIHEAVLAAFRELLPGAGFVAPPEIAGGPACFESPAQHDLMLGGRKFCGGAQRRTREGFLHQGSIQGVRLPENTGRILSNAMAVETDFLSLSASLNDEAHSLAESKYASPEWTGLR